MEDRSFLLSVIDNSTTTGINIVAVSQDYMVSVVEGLKPAGVTGMMSGGGSGTSAEHGERWDKTRSQGTGSVEVEAWFTSYRVHTG